LKRGENAKTDIFQSMNVDPLTKDGKRLFVDRVNISNPENMYVVETNPETLALFNQNRMQSDYPDKSNIIYSEPSHKKK
jgi:hypothetical protein